MRTHSLLKGRIGNQMFQYAYATANNASSISEVQPLDLHGFKLGNIPIVPISTIRHFPTWHTEAINEVPTSIPLGPDFNICGYFQCEQWIDQIGDKALEIFDFKNKIDTSEFENENTCAIHVRLGDYTNEQNKKVYVQVGESYYDACIKQILEKNPNTKFVIFSDEPEWVYSRVNLSEIKYKLILEPDPYKQLQMSMACRHHITTNSTFAWWAAKLADLKCKKEGKDLGMRFIPKDWFVLDRLIGTEKSLYCKNWILV